MEIQLKLSKDFERCLEELKKKYGEDFEYINGVHPSQLDFSEFIENFVDFQLYKYILSLHNIYLLYHQFQVGVID